MMLHNSKTINYNLDGNYELSKKYIYPVDYTLDISEKEYKSLVQSGLISHFRRGRLNI